MFEINIDLDLYFSTTINNFESCNIILQSLRPNCK